MKLKSTQHGITFFGFLYVILTLGLIFFIALKAFTPGYEYIRARSSLQAVLTVKDDPSVLTPAEVRKFFLRSAFLNELYDFNKVNIKDYLFVKLPRKAGEVKTATLRYEIRSLLIYNVYIVIDVDETIVLK